MARDTKADKTGDKGELMAQLLLSEVALVNPYKKDIGLDFFCELRDHTGVPFYVQAKASAKPTYTETTISSLPIDCKTIEEYWLNKRDPVFVLMSDATTNRTYYQIVNRDTYKPTRGEQKTYTFSIPLSNEIVRENIGNFVATVMQNQRIVSQEEAARFLEEHYEKNPELYHDLDEIDRFLEVMRGSDQEAQMDVKLLLKQRFESGVPISRKLVEGLILIFINCKDRITQHHVLDTLVILNERSIIPEILKQIERNMRLYEYRAEGEGLRHVYTDFLFQALVKLQATNRLEELRRFLSIKDTNVNRGAIRACGELKLHGTTADILCFLRHPDDGVRSDVAQALSKLNRKTVTRELIRILRASQDKLQLTGTIQTLAELRNAQVVAEILPFADDPSRDVRKAVALYLGTINPVEHISLLLHLMMDDDHKVRSEARRSVSKCLPVNHGEFEAHALPQGPTMNAEELERLALPLLIEAYENGQVLQVVSLLFLCKGSLSMPTLLDIYQNEKGHGRIFEFTGPTGEVEGMQYIDLKTAILDILKPYSLPEIQADVVKQIESADNDIRHKYIIAAGEMKLEAAFAPLINLIRQEILEDRNWIISSLVSIDSLKARAWAVDTLGSNPSLEMSLVCFDIIYRTGAEEEESDLIKAQILRLMSHADVRQDRRIYDYVDRYKVTEAVPVIVNDLAGRVELGLAYRMLDTLAAFKTPEGRDLIIYALQIAEDGWKRHFIELLGNIGDPESINTVREYSDYPDPEISKLVKRILSNTSNI